MKKVAAMVSASLLLASTASMAEVYVGGKVGESWFNGACTSTSDCDDNKEAGGVFLGYDLNEYLGIEAGYDYLGKVSAAGIDDDTVNAFTIAPKFSLPLSDQFSAYLKAGGAYVDFGSKDDMSYLGAAGVQYMATKNLAVRLEYQKLTDINTDVVKANNNLATIGVSYKFGGAEEEPQPVVQAEPVKAEPTPEPPKPVTHVYKKDLSASSSFALNSAQLTESAKSDLQEVIGLLTEYPQADVVITGHTDSTGSKQYNQVLSERRANSVADFLTENGIQTSRISTKGMGELQPVASNDTREGREKNRRVEIVVPEFEYKVTEQPTM
ncbi:OmpA family protein [Vibrio viridaestus]|uniref:OmpA family protein n=1 Tax=Vibrio viridaestus TaxID=2487322 RepID=A0A3N9TI57_9VIBR|nr:OmpA family protein [Vibrio viridaestus]RQW63978.1 OmpA family protein [Vibrio viridaestus]